MSPVQPGTVWRSPICGRNEQVQPAAHAQIPAPRASIADGNVSSCPHQGITEVPSKVPTFRVLFPEVLGVTAATLHPFPGGHRNRPSHVHGAVGAGGLMLTPSLNLSPPACFRAALLKLLVRGTLHTLKNYREPHGVLFMWTMSTKSYCSGNNQKFHYIC